MKNKSIIALLIVAILITTIEIAILIIIRNKVIAVSVCTEHGEEYYYERYGKYEGADYCYYPCCIYPDCNWRGSSVSHSGGDHTNNGACQHSLIGDTGQGENKCGVQYQTHSQSTKIKDYSKTETGHTPIYECTYPDCKGTYTGNPEGHKEKTDAAIPATCTTAGKTEGKHCSVCEKTLIAQEEVPATGHSWTSSITNATCTQPGYGSTYCETCGTPQSTGTIPALGHTGATHANGGTCTRVNNGVVCGVVYETHSQSTRVKDYSKTETGHTPIYECTFTNCIGTYIGTEENHTYVNGVCSVCSYECTHPAKTNKNDSTYHWEECNNCGEIINKEQHTFEDGECECGKTEEVTTCEHNYQIDKAGATETEHWEKCTKCGDKRNTAKHTFTNGVCSVCDYTCTHKTKINRKDDTYHWEECNNCGKIINKEQHTFEDGECECGKTEEVTTCEHNYQIDKAGATETEHWEKCTKCGDKRNTAKHTFTNGVCSVCDYICEHKTTTGKKDNTYHWEECNNCKQVINKEQHSYEDGKCECGKDEAIKTCEHENKEWKSNETEHWQVCKDCDKEIEGTREKHSYKDGKCTDCGINEAVKECEHKNKEWKSNETEHWQVCKDCGKEIEGTREKHSYKDGKCTDCGIKDSTSKQDKIPNTGIDTVTVSIIVVTVFAVVGLAGIKKYREF